MTAPRSTRLALTGIVAAAMTAITASPTSPGGLRFTVTYGANRN